MDHRCFGDRGTCPHDVTHGLQWLTRLDAPVLYACKAHIPGSWKNPLPKALTSIDLSPFLRLWPLGCREKKES